MIDNMLEQIEDQVKNHWYRLTFVLVPKKLDKDAPKNERPRIYKFSDWLTSKQSNWLVDIGGKFFLLDQDDKVPDWIDALSEKMLPGGEIADATFNYKNLDWDEWYKIFQSIGIKANGPYTYEEILELPGHLEVHDINHVDKHEDADYHYNGSEWTFETTDARITKQLDDLGVPRECGSRTIVTRAGMKRLFCGDFRNCSRCAAIRARYYTEKLVDAVALTFQTFYLVNLEDHRELSRYLTESQIPWINFPDEEGDNLMFLSPGLIVLKDKLVDYDVTAVNPSTFLKLMEVLTQTPEKKRIRISANFPMKEEDQVEIGAKLAKKQSPKQKAAEEEFGKYGSFVVDAPLEELIPYFNKYHELPMPQKLDLNFWDLTYLEDYEWAHALVDIAKDHRIWMFSNNRLNELHKGEVALYLKNFLSPPPKT